MTKLVTFLNSSLGLLLAGSCIGAIGLFTWQRQDWIAKRKYLRAQVLLDRRIDIIEKVNADVGRLLASATAPVMCIRKSAPKAQTNEAIKQYNDQQVEWFEACSSYETQFMIYFSPSLSETFTAKVFGAYKNVDITLSAYQKNDDKEYFTKAYDALENLKSELRSWNSLALSNLQEN